MVDFKLEANGTSSFERSCPVVPPFISLFDIFLYTCRNDAQFFMLRYLDERQHNHLSTEHEHVQCNR